MRSLLPLLLATLLPAAAPAVPEQEPLRVSLAARSVPPDQAAGRTVAATSVQVR
jgi:hypothetical protein